MNKRKDISGKAPCLHFAFRISHFALFTSHRIAWALYIPSLLLFSSAPCVFISHHPSLPPTTYINGQHAYFFSSVFSLMFYVYMQPYGYDRPALPILPYTPLLVPSQMKSFCLHFRVVSSPARVRPLSYIPALLSPDSVSKYILSSSSSLSCTLTALCLLIRFPCSTPYLPGH